MLTQSMDTTEGMHAQSNFLISGVPNLLQLRLNILKLLFVELVFFHLVV